MKTPLDKTGREIHVGDFIVYGHALGRCAGLRIGRVLEITEVRVQTWNANSEKKHHFRVRGVDDDWSWHPPKLLTKDGTLQFADRIVVLPTELVPEKIRRLYDDAIAVREHGGK